jgi:acetyl esterase
LRGGLPDTDANDIAEVVLSTAGGQTTGQLRAALARAVLAYDPEAAVARARFYSERGRPVEVIIWWAGRGPRNVLIRRADGQLVVRPFRGLRRLPQS